LFKPALIFNTLFILNLIAPLVLKFVLGINYPQDRTILYLFVFLICSLGFTIDWLTEIYPLRKQYFILLVLPFLYFPVHFFTHVNFTHTFHYSDDYLPTRFFEKIIKNSDSDGYPSMVGGYKSRLLVWSMYNYRSGGEQCQISWENYPGILEDYQIVDPKIYPEWTTYYDSIDYDHIGRRILYKRKEKPQVTLYQRFAPINMDTMSTRKFYILFNQPIDTMEGRAFRFDFDFTLYVPLRPFRAWVVVSVTDDKGQDLKYQYMPLQWNKPYWSGEPHNLKNRMIIPSLPKGSKFIKAYIWNLDKQAFKLNSSVCSLYTFNPEELPEALK
jgi:hypothetical protein